MSPPLFPSIQISQLDGRALSFRYKEAQFHGLYDALIESSSKLKLAIQADAFLSTTEADFEFAQALAELRLHFNSLDLQKELKAGRLVETGVDNIERTRPFPIVYIIPSRTSLAYAVLSALGAAIAAGSCIILELPQTLTQTSAVLRKILIEAIDSDTFAITASRPPADFTKQCMLVNQTEEELDPSEWAQILPSPLPRRVAVVDRTADLVEAGNAIAEAAFSFGGKGPYAPQVVLVNEFVADALLSGLVSKIGTPTKPELQNGHAGCPREREDRKLGHDTMDAKILVAGSRGRILEVLDRNTSHWAWKTGDRTIVICRVSSLDHALNLLKRQPPLAASFLFASLPEANYLSRHMKAHICTINHIPVKLLVGPVAPAHASIPSTAFPRYKPSMFTVPAPQYVAKKDGQQSSTGSLDPAFVQKLTDEFMQPLPSIVQGDGRQLNFFGEAIVVGLGMGLLSFVGVGLGSWWLIVGHGRGRLILWD